MFLALRGALFNIIVTTFFLAFMAVNALLALMSGDWRLKRVAFLYWAIWAVTYYFPYTEIIVSPAFFIALSRLQIRKPGETALAFWIVPIIAAEAGLFLSHIAYFTIDYITYWVLVQVFFITQLTSSTITGWRKSRISWNGADRRKRRATAIWAAIG